MLELGSLLGAKAGLESASITEAYEISRGALILIALDNISANLWGGIGWGVPSDFYLDPRSTKFLFGLPVSVPIEKGIFILALLEEIGLVLFSLMLLALFKFFDFRNTMSVTLALAVMLYNFTESVFASVGGVGFFCIIALVVSFPSGRLDGLVTRR